MSKFGEITFSSPIEVSPAEGHKTRGEKIATIHIDGQPLTRMPDANLRESITKAAVVEGLAVKSVGTFPELKDKGLGVRVEPL